MKDRDEVTVLKEGNVKITNLRTTIGSNTYQMSNIHSVRMYAGEPKLFIPVFFMLTAAVFLALVALTNLDDLSHYLEISLYMGMGALVFLLFSRKTKYSVRVKSSKSKGELNILEATDKESVEKIVRAMHKALSLRVSELPDRLWISLEEKPG